MVLVFSAFVLYDRQDMRTPVVFEALERINPMPKTKELIEQQKFAEAQEYLTFFLNFDYMKNNQEAKALLQSIQEKRASLAYKTGKIIKGIWTGKSDEVEGMLSAGVSDFFLFGDLRDLSIEGYHHLKGEEVDTVLVALSSIGVVSSGVTLASAGASSPIKGSISFLKYAKKSASLPTWLGKYLVKISKRKDTKAIKPLFKNISSLIKGAGVGGGLKLLHNSRGMDSLKDAVTFAKVYGKNSASLVTIVGKDVIKYQKNINKKAFLHAATYGEAGVKRLRKLGEKGFLKSLIKPIKTSRVVKVFDKNSAHLIKQIPDKVFYILGLLALLIII